MGMEMEMGMASALVDAINIIPLQTTSGLEIMKLLDIKNTIFNNSKDDNNAGFVLALQIIPII